VATRDGRRLVRRVDHARGTPASPLRPEEIREKYRRLAATVAAPARVEGIAALIDEVDRWPDLSRLAGLLRPAARASPARVAGPRGGRTTAGRPAPLPSRRAQAFT